jgi:hypothetical protein
LVCRNSKALQFSDARVVFSVFGEAVDLVFHCSERVEAPNDPKLSDGGGWRAGCTAGGKAAVEAASVTAGAVRCSAWLGASLEWKTDAMTQSK